MRRQWPRIKKSFCGFFCRKSSASSLISNGPDVHRIAPRSAISPRSAYCLSSLSSKMPRSPRRSHGGPHCHRQTPPRLSPCMRKPRCRRRPQPSQAARYISALANAARMRFGSADILPWKSSSKIIHLLGHHRVQKGQGGGIIRGPFGPIQIDKIGGLRARRRNLRGGRSATRHNK